MEETFARFKQGAVNSYLTKLPDYAEMDHVEAQILDRVARRYPDVFGRLADYCYRHRDSWTPRSPGSTARSSSISPTSS